MMCIVWIYGNECDAGVHGAWDCAAIAQEYVSDLVDAIETMKDEMNRSCNNKSGVAYSMDQFYTAG